MVGWNRRVLRLGPDHDDLARALERQRCTVTGVECDPQVGHINATLATLESDFDVAVADDSLHRLQDPQTILDSLARLLIPGGRIVASVPNAGHVDARLAKTPGSFTLPALRQMIERSGLAIVELMRVRIPAFETGSRMDRQAVPTDTLDGLLADPEAETYQFVFTAVRDDGDRQTARLFSRCEELQADVERQLVSCTSMRIEVDALERELDQVRAQSVTDVDASGSRVVVIGSLERELDAARGQASQQAEELRAAMESLHRLQDGLDAERQQRGASETELAALRATKTFRYTNWARAIYQSLSRRRS